jgi:hypothetical protein
MVRGPVLFHLRGYYVRRVRKIQGKKRWLGKPVMQQPAT